MKQRLFLLGTATFLTTTLLLVGQTPPVQGSTLEGRVIRMGTSEPVADANVLVTNGRLGPTGQLMPSLEETVQRAIANGVAIPPNIQAQLEAERARRGAGAALQVTTKSDREGRFTVGNLPAGQYTVQVEREGYFGYGTTVANNSLNFVPFATATVNVANGQASPSVSVSLMPGASVSGRVVDPEGRPVVASSVQAYRLVYQNGGTGLQSIAAADTDDRGDYRLFRIPPGEYYVGVTPGQSGNRGVGRGFGGAFGAQGRGTIAPSGETLVKTFYPGVVDINGSRPLVLRGGEDHSGIAITAQRSPIIKVSGQVTSAVSLPVQAGARGQTRTLPVQLILTRNEKNIPADADGRNTTSVSMDSPADGKFEIAGVTPGSYDLTARVNAPSPEPAVSPGSGIRVFLGRTSFTAGNRDVSGLSIVLTEGVEVKAYATVDGALPSPNIIGVSLIPILNAGLRGTGNVGPDGIVSFPGVSQGLYRFQVNLPAIGGRGARGATAFVEDIREGGVSIFDNGLLVGKEPPRPIEIVIKTNGGLVQGNVVDAKLQPVAGATVVLFPPQNRRENIALYKTAISGDKGQFGLAGIAPGQYKLFAWEVIPAGAYQNAGFISKYEERGYSLSVNAASTTNAQLSVIAADK